MTVFCAHLRKTSCVHIDLEGREREAGPMHRFIEGMHIFSLKIPLDNIQSQIVGSARSNTIREYKGRISTRHELINLLFDADLSCISKCLEVLGIVQLYQFHRSWCQIFRLHLGLIL